MMKQIYEHLKTKKKYNTLELKYDIKCEEYERKILELNAEKNIRKIEKEKYEEIIKQYVEEIEKLKSKKRKGVKNGK